MSSVLPIAISGMNGAMRRLQTAAGNIANASASGGNVEADIVELMMSRISFAANARDAEIASQTFNGLLDIKV